MLSQWDQATSLNYSKNGMILFDSCPLINEIILTINKIYRRWQSTVRHSIDDKRLDFEAVDGREMLRVRS